MRHLGPNASASAEMVRRPTTEMLATTYEALSVLHHQETKKSWTSPFLTDAMREALKFMKKKADWMDLRVKQLTDPFAPDIEVI